MISDRFTPEWFEELRRKANAVAKLHADFRESKEREMEAAISLVEAIETTPLDRATIEQIRANIVAMKWHKRGYFIRDTIVDACDEVIERISEEQCG